MKKEIKSVFYNCNQDEIFNEAFCLAFTYKDIRTLNHLNWLNDEVIFCSLCMQIAKRVRKLKEGVTSLFCR